MKCDHCDHEFNIYMFAYRQIRKCPTCGQMYDMKFPMGTGFIPVLIALLICVFLTMGIEYDVLVSASLFIVIYYVLDIAMKLLFIYTDHYTMEKLDR